MSRSAASYEKATKQRSWCKVATDLLERGLLLERNSRQALLGEPKALGLASSQGRWCTLQSTLSTILQDGDHGTASGILTWKGEKKQQLLLACLGAGNRFPINMSGDARVAGKAQSEKPKRINGVLKKVWKHMEQDRKLQWQHVAKPNLQAETP